MTYASVCGERSHIVYARKQNEPNDLGKQMYIASED